MSKCGKITCLFVTLFVTEILTPGAFAADRRMQVCLSSISGKITAKVKCANKEIVLDAESVGALSASDTKTITIQGPQGATGPEGKTGATGSQGPKGD